MPSQLQHEGWSRGYFPDLLKVERSAFNQVCCCTHAPATHLHALSESHPPPLLAQAKCENAVFEDEISDGVFKYSEYRWQSTSSGNRWEHAWRYKFEHELRSQVPSLHLSDPACS